MLVAILEGDELSKVELKLNLVMGKGGFIYIVYETLSGTKENNDLNRVTTYLDDDL